MTTSALRGAQMGLVQASYSLGAVESYHCTAPVPLRVFLYVSLTDQE